MNYNGLGTSRFRVRLGLGLDMNYNVTLEMLYWREGVNIVCGRCHKL